MAAWDADPQFADFRALAQKIEATIAASNDLLLKAAGLTPEQILPACKAVQGKMLGFDAHAMQGFTEALENKRVATLAQGNLTMTCILSAAVALSEFKKQPVKARGSLLDRQLDKLRLHSTNSLSLSVFAWASFHGVMGASTLQKLKALRRKHSVIKAK